MWGRRARLDEHWSHTCIRLTHQIKGVLKIWNMELIADTALRMYHSVAGHAARLPKEHFLYDLVRYNAVTSTGQRKIWGRPKDWDTRLKAFHPQDWWLLTSNRNLWKVLGHNSVAGRCWEFGMQSPQDRGRDLTLKWTAKFNSLMGSPVLGSFRDRTLLLIGTKQRTIDLVLGRGRACARPDTTTTTRPLLDHQKSAVRLPRRTELLHSRKQNKWSDSLRTSQQEDHMAP